MMTFYPPGEKGIACLDLAFCPDLTRRAVWIDLFEPTDEEEVVIEAALGINIPTRQELQEIELSSRLYRQDDVLFLTATVLTKADAEFAESTAVTFVLTADRLVTVRYADPIPFGVFRARREAHPDQYATNHQLFVGLVDAIVERVADILENVGNGLDQVSREIFRADGSPTNHVVVPAALPRPEEPVTAAKSAAAATAVAAPLSASVSKPPPRDYNEILRRIGRRSDLVSRARESLVSLGRLVSFVREVQKEVSAAREGLVHLKSVAGDLASLGDHASFLSGKVSFLLDATLGLINNEQNSIIKIMSVAATVFLPPTLVASIYGMNFEWMPELKWAHGYPLAILLMIISAVLPYVWFKRKGWL